MVKYLCIFPLHGCVKTNILYSHWDAGPVFLPTHILYIQSSQQLLHLFLSYYKILKTIKISFDFLFLTADAKLHLIKILKKIKVCKERLCVPKHDDDCCLN